MQTLTENLYFKNLDNNAGVSHRLVDDAEEEECKEAMLGYYFLLSRPELTSTSALDEAIEGWFKETWNCDLDFEVEDSLAKLVELGLVSRKTDEAHNDTIEAMSLDECIRQLNTRWDEYFSPSIR